MEKQIEEMMNDIWNAELNFYDYCSKNSCNECIYTYKDIVECKFNDMAKNLYKKGYRKELDILREINDIIRKLKIEIETADESLISQDLKTPCLAVLMLLQTEILEKYKEKGYE